MKNWLVTSFTPSGSNERLSQGDELVIMYQRTASAPNCWMHSNGLMTLPRRFDILMPFLSSTSPLEITALYATESNTIVAMAWSVKNQPRVWSTPSAMKFAGKAVPFSMSSLFSNG